MVPRFPRALGAPSFGRGGKQVSEQFSELSGARLFTQWDLRLCLLQRGGISPGFSLSLADDQLETDEALSNTPAELGGSTHSIDAL